MNWKELITSILLLGCSGLLAGCSPSEDNGGTTPTDKEALTGNGDLLPKPCPTKPTLSGTPVDIDRDFHFTAPPSAGVHLKLGQTMHVMGPTQDNTYVLRPVESTPQHSWPTSVDHVATPSTVANEYCVSTEISDDGHASPTAHRFVFRVLSNDPPEFCIQRPVGNQCGNSVDNAHVEQSHGGSADLL